MLQLGGHRAIVPAEIAAMLLDEQRTTTDVAADVLTLEAELRALDARLAVKVAASTADVAALGRRLADLGKTWFGGRRRATARTEFQEAIRVQSETRDIHAEILTLNRILRSFVIAMEPEDGLLAEAAAGWARSPAIPAGVSVFQDISYFLTDTRRASPPGGLDGTIGGETFGELWRRDGDDPVEQPLARAGCWQIGYIERTEEIYAVRRCESREREVWLLGRGFSSSRAHDLVLPLIRRMPEPNSLILVAETVVAALHEHTDGPA